MGSEPTSVTIASSEDSRGVDVEQIQRQLRLSPLERLRSMAQVANRLRALAEKAAERG
jgi:hypothetical protein